MCLVVGHKINIKTRISKRFWQKNIGVTFPGRKPMQAGL